MDGENGLTQLPVHLFVNIISRLPIKILAICRCVCKTWDTLICHPRFIMMYRDRLTRDLDNVGKNVMGEFEYEENKQILSEIMFLVEDDCIENMGLLRPQFMLSKCVQELGKFKVVEPYYETIYVCNHEIGDSTYKLMDWEIVSSIGFDQTENGYKVVKAVLMEAGIGFDVVTHARSFISLSPWGFGLRAHNRMITRGTTLVAYIDRNQVRLIGEGRGTDRISGLISGGQNEKVERLTNKILVGITGSPAAGDAIIRYLQDILKDKQHQKSEKMDVIKRGCQQYLKKWKTTNRVELSCGLIFVGNMKGKKTIVQFDHHELNTYKADKTYVVMGSGGQFAKDYVKEQQKLGKGINVQMIMESVAESCLRDKFSRGYITSHVLGVGGKITMDQGGEHFLRVLADSYVRFETRLRSCLLCISTGVGYTKNDEKSIKALINSKYEEFNQWLILGIRFGTNPSETVIIRLVRFKDKDYADANYEKNSDFLVTKDGIGEGRAQFGHEEDRAEFELKIIRPSQEAIEGLLTAYHPFDF